MPPLPLPRPGRSRTHAAAWCLLLGGWLLAPSAQAQQQEKGFLDRLDHPDRTLHYSPSDKSFSASSSVAGKQAMVRAYTFKGSGAFGAGDGVFRTRGYNGEEKFRTQSYATKPAAAASQGFSQTDKTFGTKTVDMKEDRAANQTAAAVRDYAPASKPFLGRGRRQDSIDDLRNQKNLTIDQVREILNKNK